MRNSKARLQIKVFGIINVEGEKRQNAHTMSDKASKITKSSMATNPVNGLQQATTSYVRRVEIAHLCKHLLYAIPVRQAHGVSRGHASKPKVPYVDLGI